MNYQSVVYVSHPYGGNKLNLKLVGNLIRNLHKMYPNYLFISPIHAFSHMYDYVDYEIGLDMCLWLLDSCDEMWVFGDYQNSVGCTKEIEYAHNHLIPYRIISNACLHLKSNNSFLCNECGLVEYDEYFITCKKKDMEYAYEEASYKCKGENINT